MELQGKKTCLLHMIRCACLEAHYFESIAEQQSSVEEHKAYNPSMKNRNWDIEK